MNKVYPLFAWRVTSALVSFLMLNIAHATIQISNCNDLQNIAQNPTAQYELVVDIARAMVGEGNPREEIPDIQQSSDSTKTK